MEELRAAIAQKRAASSCGDKEQPKKRWRRLGEIEEEREADYRANQRQKAETAALREAEKRKKEEAELRVLQSSAKVEEKTDGDERADVLLSKEEVIKRLRLMKEPATLFGEEEKERFARLRRLEVEYEGRKGESTKGQTNVYQKKLREMEARDRDDDLYGKDTKSANAVRIEKSTGDAKDSKKTIEKADGRTNENGKIVKMDFEEQLVQHSINKWMGLWKKEVDELPAHEKKTNKGRSIAARYEQTNEYLKPLYRLLDRRKLPKNILTSLKKIFESVEQKEYVQANDFYLQLAIGNAPWPMGATMVGIHARSAREKIGEGKIAHVMNDEQTRKYIQAVKRLVTLAQRIAPTVPSKMISS